MADVGWRKLTDMWNCPKLAQVKKKDCRCEERLGNIFGNVEKRVLV
jgi:hypothetical protein